MTPTMTIAATTITTVTAVITTMTMPTTVTRTTSNVALLSCCCCLFGLAASWFVAAAIASVLQAMKLAEEAMKPGSLAVCATSPCWRTQRKINHAMNLDSMETEYIREFDMKIGKHSERDSDMKLGSFVAEHLNASKAIETKPRTIFRCRSACGTQRT